MHFEKENVRVKMGGPAISLLFVLLALIVFNFSYFKSMYFWTASCLAFSTFLYVSFLNFVKKSERRAYLEAGYNLVSLSALLALCFIVIERGSAENWLAAIIFTSLVFGCVVFFVLKFAFLTFFSGFTKIR